MWSPLRRPFESLANNYIRHEDILLEAKDGGNVEFVSNVYDENHIRGHPAQHSRHFAASVHLQSEVSLRVFTEGSRSFRRLE